MEDGILFSKLATQCINKISSQNEATKMK